MLALCSVNSRLTSTCEADGRFAAPFSVFSVHRTVLILLQRIYTKSSGPDRH